MPVTVSKAVEVTVTAKDFVSQCGIDDVACFATALAQKLDQDFVGRAHAANAFAEGLSEFGARWLAEVVTSFYARKR
ncbi:hypothetical protein [Ideonella sp.]|uniref:hypothetical protein n=1 Tax=Ideonella sp. TaxID=1929293 RepID=UPI003BB5630B